MEVSVLNSLKGKIAVSLVVTGIITLSVLSSASAGGVTVFKDGDKYVKMGGRIQMQYHKKDPDGKEGTDSVFFRRFRPYLEGSTHKNWKGKFQWDMGKAKEGNELAVKDAYIQYKGFSSNKLTIGNTKTPFSREFLTSSKKQQLVERTFVGDHNYGSPDRMLGLKLEGHNESKKLEYGVAFGSESIDPDDDKLDFDSPVNKNSDFNEGWVAAARLDFHPLGPLKKSQGDFKGDTKATIGVGVFTWSNDDDNNTRFCDGQDRKSCDSTSSGYTKASGKPDVDSVTGLEVSAAFRGKGLSVDAQYNSIDTDTVDPSITSGIYKSGSTTLENLAVEAGYMVVPSKLEVVVGYQSQDADNYTDTWTRTSFGLNWFIKEHDIKLQTTYRMGENLKGKKDNDEDELFVQMQYVF